MWQNPGWLSPKHTKRFPNCFTLRITVISHCGKYAAVSVFTNSGEAPAVKRLADVSRGSTCCWIFMSNPLIKEKHGMTRKTCESTVTLIHLGAHVEGWECRWEHEHVTTKRWGSESRTERHWDRQSPGQLWTGETAEPRYKTGSRVTC